MYTYIHNIYVHILYIICNYVCVLYINTQILSVQTEEECLKIVEELMVKQEQIKEVLATQSSNIEKIHIQIEEERKKVLAVDR